VIGIHTQTDRHSVYFIFSLTHTNHLVPNHNMSSKKNESIAARVRRRKRADAKRRTVNGRYDDGLRSDPDYMSSGCSESNSSGMDWSDDQLSSGSESDSEPLSSKAKGRARPRSVAEPVDQQQDPHFVPVGYALLYEVIMKSLSMKRDDAVRSFKDLQAQPSAGEAWRKCLPPAGAPMVAAQGVCDSVVVQLRHQMKLEDNRQDPTFGTVERELDAHALEVKLARSRIVRNLEQNKVAVSESELKKNQTKVGEEHKKLVMTTIEVCEQEEKLCEKKEKLCEKKEKLCEKKEKLVVAMGGEVEQFLKVMMDISKYEGKVQECDMELARERIRSQLFPHSKSKVLPCAPFNGHEKPNPMGLQITVSCVMWELYPNEMKTFTQDTKVDLYKEVGKRLVAVYTAHYKERPPQHVKKSGVTANTYYNRDRRLMVGCIQEIFQERGYRE
jgi:hypothetical protein